MLLLDTSVLIELESELATEHVGPVRSYLGRSKSERHACSVVSIGEFAAGSSEAAARVFFRHLKKISVNEVVAYRAASLEQQLARAGQRLGENDNWIAATALTVSATLVYCDGDFARVPGLKHRRLTPG